MRTSVFLYLGVGLGICNADIIPVTGSKTGLGQQSLPARHNIRQLEKSGPQWYANDVNFVVEQKLLNVTRDLFIQGLLSFQKVTEEDQLSYFQISGKLPLLNLLRSSVGDNRSAGIHGRPYMASSKSKEHPSTGIARTMKSCLRSGIVHWLLSLRYAIHP